MPTPQAPAPPAPPSADVPRVFVDGVPVPGFGTTTELTAQRRDLMQQLRDLESEKASMTARLRTLPKGTNERAAFQAQMDATDARIATTDALLATNEAQLELGNTPGVISVPPPFAQERVLPRDIFFLTCLFTVIVFLPLSVAMARRIWRRGSNAVASLPTDLAERLGRMEMAIDSSAVEIERIGEGQRYLTKLLSERNAQELALSRADARERITAP